ncbi:MAG: cell surface protein SprA, partial [Alloprevotella sp.]|nr:cell surface protein SprA [Alloprevotella sp.]
TKVAMGSEPLNNTLWGLNLTWKKESQWLTNMLDRLPILHCTAPSQINFSAEFAQLVAGSVKGTQGSASYIDDFENAKNEIDISQPTEWTLCSTPSMFAESKLTNDVRYGYNRALLAWYYIDPLFTRRSSSLTPGHIKSDLKQLSDPRVRDIYKNELFPNKSINFKEASTLSVLNLAYYPNERGAYNLDPALDADGRLTNPAKRWGGMMRKLEMSDFETANIEYIEFWLMDPFITARNNGTPLPTGDLYFNLGEISEDILKDGKKYYESGMPVDGSPAQYTETVWGRVPTQNSITYAFSTQGGSRQRQDIGLNGLSSEDEAQFPTYANYLQQIRSIVRPEVYDSIVASPSADRYHYFRGTDFDEAQTSILDRYKRINLPNGNSVDAEHSPESYATAYTLQPDVEDVNLDYTLNEYEKYYQYRVSIRPEDMVVGRNFIVDHRETATTTRDNNKVTTDWYLFRIPIDRYEKREGAINDFSSIRFMRLFLTGFEQPVVLRMATFNLVHGEWRGYEQALYTGSAPDVSGSLSISAVNFEENNEKTPVNYVLPPGISRVIDPGQEQVLQDNEQALALTVEHLAPGDARAVYKNTTLDLRRYRHIQMFAHANALPGDNTLADGQTSLFIRLGSDYRNNFYEYEIPLKVTPEGQYSNGGAGSMSVWPADNMLDIDLSLLTQAKRNRNHQRSLGLADYTRLYSEYDAARPACKISIMGNPSLGEVRTVMIGVRNNSREVKSVEVWANELRLQQYSNKGGWAARGTLNVKLSDVATVNLSGHVETNGFGGIEESVAQRRDDDLYQYSITTQVDAGR